MTLGSTRVVVQGETPYAHERAAIEFAIATLPGSDPYHLWALLELLEPSTGRLYEIDMLVLGYSAFYLVEVKSGPGVYEGDHQDWYRTDPSDPRPRYMENPYRLTNLKAKVLANLLRAKLRGKADPPWVEPLVFLSAEGVQLRLASFGDHGVVTRETFLRAIQHHDYPGADRGRPRSRISTPVAREVAAALKALGLRPRAGKAHAGAFELGDLLGEGPGYQDRVAVHRSQRSMTCRARTYLVPQQTSVERRQQLRRAADRESQLLWELREHPNVLRMAGYETDAPLGPAVLFDAFEGGVPLSAALRQSPPLDFPARVAIVEQVGRALGFCHRKRIVHGALGPESVLVRHHADSGRVETRLFNFQLAAGTDVEATTHWSALAAEPWALYQAPELREDPTARTPQSDVFSLGALAYHVFTGRPPAESVVELSRRLAADKHLDPRAVDDGIPEGVAELVRLATELSPVSRWNDADEWVALLLEEVTRPAAADAPAAEPALDPLEARAGDALGDDLLVESVLGQGATSRVLAVTRVSDGRTFALKVPLSAEHAERLAEEAETIAALRHSRIVELAGRPMLAGRTCLLLSLAGAETLHRLLAREGTVSLDLASRYGDDLLSALEHLEERQVLHRDIKPANLGVGVVSKTAAHLTLFDFSLARARPGDIQVGTAAYRDPFLSLRGTWDHAAERWSAAVTLHEMLTGARPGYGVSALDPAASLALSAERFDPSVREGLVAFFQRALARDAETRFASAEEMRRAWLAAFGPSQPAVAAEPALPPSEHPDVPEPPDDAQLAAIAPTTPIAALPLSARARNALDRAGLLTAGDIVDLADNRLSAVRGIGQLVAREILDFRTRWTALRKPSAEEATPFYPGYRGDDLLLHACGLDEELATALRDAGLRTLAAVAAAPARQVKAVVERHGHGARALREVLDDENRRANERERPSTLEGWIDALLPRRRARMKHPRLLYGLDGDPPGRLGLAVKDLADSLGLTTAAIYIALGKARDDWARHGALPELHALAVEVLDAAGGAAPLAELAELLAVRIPYDRALPPERAHVMAAALLRVVAEVAKGAEEGQAGAGLRHVRLGRGQPWICASEEHTAALRALGAAADQLAARPVVAGQGETERALADVVSGTPLEKVPRERLAELAAAASERAARSARLELYPRGMEAERALALSAALLRDEVAADEVARRVAARYPEAQALPPRPALDALLTPYGLRWDEAAERYLREGATERTSLHTRISSLGRTATALPWQRLSMEPEAVVARQFDERLRNAVERRHLRVLGVRAERAREAALALAKQLGVEPTPLDKLLVEAIREESRKGGIRKESVVHDADRAGPAGERWPNLLRLAEAAATRIADRLLPPARPLLLVQPGLLARYRLESFLARLLEAARSPEAAAILLLVPAHDTGGIPRINGELAVPGLLPSQALWIPPEWLANRHHAAA